MKRTRSLRKQAKKAGVLGTAKVRTIFARVSKAPSALFIGSVCLEYSSRQSSCVRCMEFCTCAHTTTHTHIRSLTHMRVLKAFIAKQVQREGAREREREREERGEREEEEREREDR